MTNTQHAELMAELRAIRILLARPLYDAPAAMNELANAIVEGNPEPAIPAEVLERAATLGPVANGATGERAATFMQSGSPPPDLSEASVTRRTVHVNAEPHVPRGKRGRK